MLHSEEFDLAVCFISLMINFDHKSFYVVLPLLVYTICNVIHKNKVQYFNQTLLINAFIDIGKLQGSFFIPFATMWLPWITHPRELFKSVYTIYWHNNGHHTVNIHCNLWHIFGQNQELYWFIPFIVYSIIQIPMTSFY